MNIPAPIYPESAERAVELFGDLRLPDVPGKPLMREAMPQWAFDLVAAQFGGLDPETGRQTIRETLVLIAKKSGKTTVAAGLMLVANILSWRENDEFLILSATKEAASTAYNAASGMVRADPELRELFHVRSHVREIRHRVTDNTIKVVAADSSIVAGKLAGHVLVDELSFLAQKRGAEAMLMEAVGGLTARPEGWVIYLTTQSDSPPVGVFRSKLQYARQVANGEVEDESFLPVLFEPPPGADPHDPAIFRYGNPSLGYSVDEGWLRRQYESVRNATDGSFQLFMAKHANVEIGMATSSDIWPGAVYWERQEVPLTLDAILERSEVITVGIDGGGLDDWLGLYILGRDRTDKKKLGWAHAWCNRIVLDRRAEIAAEMESFASDGDLTICATGEDVRQLAGVVKRVFDSGLMDRIGVDPAGVASITEALQEAGVPEDAVIGISQGWRLFAHAQATERALADGSFTPAAQPMMKWCVSNAAVEPRSNTAIVTKKASGRAKIDPVMALFDAFALMATNPGPRQRHIAVFSL